MTDIPVAEVIGNRRYGGRYTARVLCPFCDRTHLHLWPADADTPLAAHCERGNYTIGTATTPTERNHA
jgi:hypothetical protein